MWALAETRPADWFVCAVGCCLIVTFTVTEAVQSPA